VPALTWASRSRSALSNRYGLRPDAYLTIGILAAVEAIGGLLIPFEFTLCIVLWADGIALDEFFGRSSFFSCRRKPVKLG
jgi:hypothetical protein